RCCKKIVRRDRAAQRRSQWRLHAHCKARPAQERFRLNGVHRMGRCRTSDRGKTSGRKEGEAKRERAACETETASCETRRSGSSGEEGNARAASRRAEAEKAQVVRRKIGGSGKIIRGPLRCARWIDRSAGRCYLT